MPWLRTFVALVLALSGVACSESRTLGEDAGITVMIDAAPRPDGGDGGVMMMGPVCGNGRVEAMEACDDGNVEPGDGCDPMCAREAYCGDETITAPEVCDDGNNRSADGCRSDCLSTETCGNSIVDYATGEVCDGTPGCAVDCQSLTGCGDGTVASPEQCDDGNTTRWDGCGADCRQEPTLVVERLQVGSTMQGCDYSGDGTPDNRLARALGAASALLNMGLAGGGGGGPTFLMSFQGLDDRTAANDDALRVAWLLGRAGMAAGTYQVDPSSLNADGTAVTSLQGDLVSRALDAGPEDIDIPVGFLPLTLYQGRVRGTTTATGGELSGLDAGLLCGVVPPTQFSGINADLLRMLGGGGGFMIEIGDPCDGSREPATLADMLVGGVTLFGLRIGNVPPDVDLDGDGLETFEVTRMGPMGCQPVVTACIDGDGTRVEGRACIDDPRIVDGYSAGLTFTASRTRLEASASTPPGPAPAPGG